MSLTAAQALPLQLEAWSPYIADLVETDAELSRFLGNGNGGATRVSQRLFRARLKVAKSGNYGGIDLENGSISPGTGNKWDQMLLSPVAIHKSIQYSHLARLMEGEGVATDNPVMDTLSDVISEIATIRDIGLQNPGDGSLGSVDSVNGLYIIMRSPSTSTKDGRGANQLRAQQTVEVVAPTTYLSRGTCTISQVFNPLGGVQQILVDAVPANNGGVQAGDLVIVVGLASGAPDYIHGIPYQVSTSAAGFLNGLSRALQYTQANGFDLAGVAQVTKPVFRIQSNQIKQRLGTKGLKDQFLHTHPSQVQAVEELGFADSYVPLEGGKAKSYDPMFSSITIDGRPIHENIHADQTAWDLLLKQAWSTIKWGAGMFWLKNRGNQMIFQVVDPVSGMPTVQEICAYVVAEQWYCSNPIAQSRLTGCKVPTGN